MYVQSDSLDLAAFICELKDCESGITQTNSHFWVWADDPVALTLCRE